MDQEEVMRVSGEVIENLPNTLFRVVLDKDHGSREIICYLSGKMRKHYIKILPGDKVTIEMTRYDLNRGRIVYRS